MNSNSNPPFFDPSKLADWSNLGQAVSGFATAIALIATAIAAWLTFQSIKVARAVQRESDAQNTFRDYLRLAIEYPQFSSGVVWVSEPDDEFGYQYEWYVAYMLKALDGILTDVQNKYEWKETILVNLRMHMTYFQKSDFIRENRHSVYSKALNEFIDTAISMKPPKNQ